MPCYSPLRGYVAKTANETGKHSVVFNHRDGWIDRPVTLPCGRCIGCRLERSRQWAVRCIHEASLFQNNCFITLTYSPDRIPFNGSLVKSHFQKFMKRLRKKYSDGFWFPSADVAYRVWIQHTGIRFFQCGEYGDQLSRPHYHACLFNFDFPDKTLWSVRGDVKLYRSAILETLWPYGFSTVGDVTFESAAYVARYCTKKITGKPAEAHYQGRLPEYVTMSRGGKDGHGIGYDWFQKYSSDVFPNDYLIVRGVKCRPGRYYDNLYDLTNSDKFSKLKLSREKSAKGNPHNSSARLKEREFVANTNYQKLRRGYENESV